MPAATWGWLKIKTDQARASASLPPLPTGAVEVEGLDEQFAGMADAFDAAMDAMAERFPERRASAPGDAADRARMHAQTELDVPPPPSTRPVPSSWRRSSPPLRPSRLAWARLPTYLADHATKRVVIDVPTYTSTPRLPCV